MSYYGSPDSLSSSPPQYTSASTMAGLTVQYFIRHFWRWAILSALAFIPVSVVLIGVFQYTFDFTLTLEGVSADTLPDPGALIGPLLVGILLGIGVSLLQMLLLGGAGSVMATAIHNNQPPSLVTALYQAVKIRGRALVGGYLYVGLLLVAGFTVSVIATMICVGAVGLWVCFFAYIVWTPLLSAVLVLERGPLRVLLKRAWHFGKVRVWVLVAALLAIAVWGALLQLSMTSILESMLADATGGRFITSLSDIADAYWPLIGTMLLLQFILQTLTVPLNVIFFTLLYHDTRQQFDPLSDPDAIDGPDAPDAYPAPDASVAYPAPDDPYLAPTDLRILILVPMVFVGAAYVVTLIFGGGAIGGAGF